MVREWFCKRHPESMLVFGHRIQHCPACHRGVGLVALWSELKTAQTPKTYDHLSWSGKWPLYHSPHGPHAKGITERGRLSMSG